MKRTSLRTITLLIASLFATDILQAEDAAPAKPNGAPRQRKWPQQKAEWLYPIHEAQNGARYATFASKVLGRDASYLVWLPPGYEEESKRFPVIYWLHGMGANQRGGAQMFVPQFEAAMKEGRLPPCIVVLVNGMVKSFYCESSDGKIPMESVIIKDRIPHVDATHRTIARREGRVIEGYSLGATARRSSESNFPSYPAPS
jgi:endo-1,4-beta-xylanase